MKAQNTIPLVPPENLQGKDQVRHLSCPPLQGALNQPPSHDWPTPCDGIISLPTTPRAWREGF